MRIWRGPNEVRMNRLRRYLSLTAGDRRLLARAAFLVGAIRIGLWLIPFQSMRRMLAWITHSPGGQRPIARISSDRIAWAVRAAGRHVPKATCLVQALAAQVLLRREGYPASFCIGVARSEEEKVQAHAWVESEGKVVVGGSELERYTRLLALRGE